MGWVRSHKWIVAGVLGVVVLVLALAAAAYGYDRSRSDVIVKGIRVGSINVGGLDAQAARAKLKRAFHPLHKPVVLRYADRRLVLTPEQARVSIDLNALIARALAASRTGWFGPRAWRDLTGEHVKLRIRTRIRYSQPAVRHVVDTLERRLDKSPKDARVEPSFDRVTVVRGHYGRAVETHRLRRMIRQALISRHATRFISVPTHVLHPKVTVGKLRRKYPSYMTIDRGAFTLRVYQDLRLVKSYPIAVGQAGLETPAGIYHVQDKQVDPWWHVPNSAWAGSLAGQVIPPGPSDPLKARWMGLFNGAGIHGTEETWSIGHAVSHGCVRMLIPDVIDLYDRVDVGTPVYIGD
jgi:L,D-transpeptidase catalytic domain/Putative peptidoglycan binding domain